MHVLALLALLDSNCEIANIKIANQNLKLQVANTASERKRGLMHVNDIEPYEGMIFAYKHPGHVQFWMENTPLPLDMLFFDANGQSVSTHEDAKPFDPTPIDGGEGVQYVIELAARKFEAVVLEPENQILLLSCEPNG
ncbi:DUF192 domain-containing protein [Ensifer aridi]|uniref:DUF192 domain-containing protein n=1 Tax=Ensifer aridi TaxID=1708715 RepID=UPI000A1047B0|nr:DUF192 domain-containing protein [Ensifer aridi]